MKILLFRNKLQEENLVNFPVETGDFVLNINIPLNNGQKEQYDTYLATTVRGGKKRFLEDNFTTENQVKRFKQHVGLYKKIINIDKNDLIFITNWSTRNILEYSQNFSSSQYRSKEVNIESDTVNIHIHVLRANIKKNYYNPKEVGLFRGPGKICVVSDEYHDIALYRGLGVVRYDDFHYIPFQVLKNNNDSELTTLHDLQKLTNYFVDQLEIDPVNFTIEIDIHSPALGYLKIGVQMIAVTTQTVMVEINNASPSSLPEVQNFKEVLEESAAIDHSTNINAESIQNAAYDIDESLVIHVPKNRQ